MKISGKKIQTQKNGFSLIEVIFVIFILAISTITIYSLFNMSLHMVWENKARIGATQLANQKLEVIRNLPYDDIGTTTGSPAGILPENENIILNGINYTVYTTVVYVDDVFDDQVPTDTLGNDYKRAKVSISWQSEFTKTPVDFFTDVAPRGVETDIGGGTLSFTVFDISGFPVDSAAIHVYNPSVSIDANYFTSAGGTLVLPGMPAVADSYAITVTKSGYSTDATYDATPELPGPVPGHLSVFEGQITSKSFSIDYLGDLQLNVSDSQGLALGNLDVHLWGDKTIGTDGQGESVYKYDQIHATNASGIVNLDDIEWDNYHIEIPTSTGWTIGQTSPLAPVLVMPSTSQTVIVTASSTADHSLLAIVTDSEDSPLEDALIHVTNTLGYDNTISTGSAGQAYFTPLAEATTTVAVTKTGYENYSNTFSLTGYTKEPVILIEE